MAYMWGENLLLVGRKGFHSREAGNGCNHHAGKELHGGDILIIEGVRGCGEYLEYSQGPLKLAERCRQDGAHSQAAASCQVHLRIVSSASLQSTTSPLRRHSAETPESVCRRTPISGAVRHERGR